MTSLAQPGERASPRARWAWLVAIVVALLAFRLVLLEWSFEALFTPGYELFPMGTLGLELLNGMPSLPVFEFHDTHSGGQILSALLSAAAFKLFGATYWALKLVPVFFAMLTIAFLYLFLERWYGLRAALIGSALWLFGPAAYVDYSTANYGNHSEVLAFVALTLFPLWRRFVDGDRSTTTHFLLGLTCGLAVWYSLSSLLLLVLYAALWFVVERAFFRTRGFLVFVLGVFVGTLPLWHVMATYDAPQAEWMENKFAAEGTGLFSAQTAERLVDYCSRLWFESPTFYAFGPLRGEWLSATYALAWTAVLIGLLVLSGRVLGRFFARMTFLSKAPIDSRPAVLIPLLGYPFALAAAYAASNFKIGNWPDFFWAGYRYCITSFFVMNILFVIAWRELRARGWTKSANGLIALVLAIGVLGNAGHPFSAASRGIGRHHDGFNYVQMGRLFQLERWRDRPREEVWAAIEELEPWKRYDILLGTGYCGALFAGLRGPDGSGKATTTFVPGSLAKPWVGAKVPRSCAEAVVMGAGMMLAHFHRDEPKRIIDSVEKYRGAERRFFIHGLFVTGDYVGTPEVKRRTSGALRMLKRLKDPEDRTFVVEGLGIFAGFVAWRDIRQEDEYVVQLFEEVKRMTPEEQESFVLGFGMSCTRYFSDTHYYDALLTRWIPAGALPTVFRGIGMVAERVWRYHARDVAAAATPLITKYRNDVARGLAWRDEEVRAKKAAAKENAAKKVAKDPKPPKEPVGDESPTPSKVSDTPAPLSDDSK
ncbi:MAG: glycosyltransferase family 39 protein [Planctomycetes bacterium]|nr:glycosyltransferase family 39 protein [Planctomycetota bacterium]